jgi:hypothetical protein
VVAERVKAAEEQVANLHAAITPLRAAAAVRAEASTAGMAAEGGPGAGQEDGLAGRMDALQRQVEALRAAAGGQVAGRAGGGPEAVADQVWGMKEVARESVACRS